MNRLNTASYSFVALDGGLITDADQRAKMLSNFMAPQSLVLRKDAQVMLIKNVDDLLVNGSIGRIVDFVDPVVHRERGGEDTSSKDAKKITASLGTGKLYPLVDFALPNGGKQMRLVMPETFTVELPGGEIQVSRVQVSRTTAHIHFILTLNAIDITDPSHLIVGHVYPQVARTDTRTRQGGPKTNFREGFVALSCRTSHLRFHLAIGQAYVALSRATSMEGLQVLGFDPRKVCVRYLLIEHSYIFDLLGDGSPSSHRVEQHAPGGPG
jgi:ATP-dependent DNA helicase PIF1